MGGSALHVMLFLKNLIRALWIFNGLRSRHCQRALLVYHYHPFRGLQDTSKRSDRTDHVVIGQDEHGRRLADDVHGYVASTPRGTWHGQLECEADWLVVNAVRVDRMQPPL